MNIEIEYCVPCGHLDRAIETQRALLEEFGRDLDEVRLRTGDGGVFKVRTGEELLLDAQEDGYDVERITKEVASRLTG